MKKWGCAPRQAPVCSESQARDTALRQGQDTTGHRQPVPQGWQEKPHTHSWGSPFGMNTVGTQQTGLSLHSRKRTPKRWRSPATERGSPRLISIHPAAAAAKSLQSCPTLWDPIDGSPLGSPVPGILQARTLEWVAISFSNAWKWSRAVVSDSSRPHGLQPTRLLCPWDFPGKSTGVGCHCHPSYSPPFSRLISPSLFFLH